MGGRSVVLPSQRSPWPGTDERPNGYQSEACCTPDVCEHLRDGQIDLSGLREVYVRCPTLSDGSSVTTDNRRDVIATVVCDVPLGRLMSYRPYSFAERELLQLNNEIPVSLRCLSG